jgi:hypothetical protein
MNSALPSVREKTTSSSKTRWNKRLPDFNGRWLRLMVAMEKKTGMRRKMLDEIAQEAVADGVYDVIPPTVDFGLDQSRPRDESSIEVSPVFSRRGEKPPVKQSGQSKPM